MTYVDLDTINLSQIPLNIIDQKFQQKYQILPLVQENKKLLLAIVDPTQQLIFDEIRFATGLILEYKIADEQKFIQLLKKIQETPLIKKNIINLVDSHHSKKTQSKDDNLAKTLNDSGDGDLSIINYVEHIEPYPDQLLIRFRIDGLLYSIMDLPQHLISRIITRIKIMSQLDIAERRIPQDGRFS